MFPILFRILTIAGTCTLAALLTRKFLQLKAEREGSGDEHEQNRLPEAARKKAELRLEDKQVCEPDKAEKEVKKAEKALDIKAEKEADMKAAAQKAGDAKQFMKQQADERAEKVAKSKQAALAAQQAVASRKELNARKTGSNAGKGQKDFSVPAGAETVELSKKEREKTQVEKSDDPAYEKARVVIQSSKQILESYKHPQGVKVDLSLARFSIDTAERLMSQQRYEEAWEKASPVGMLVSMAEMRGSIEKQLAELKGDQSASEKLNEIKAILKSADAFMAEASQSFVSDSASHGDLMGKLQAAFQKTMEAQEQLAKVRS